MDEDDFFDVVCSESPKLINSERMQRINPIYLKYWNDYLNGFVFEDFTLYRNYVWYHEWYTSHNGMTPKDEKSIEFLEQKFNELKEMEE